jgi:hypothetical protein
MKPRTLSAPRKKTQKPERPYYPDFACHMAPLRPASAPLDDCECRVCKFFRDEEA